MLAKDTKIPYKNDYIIHCTTESMNFILASVALVPLVLSKQYSDRPGWLVSTQWFYITAEEPHTLAHCYQHGCPAFSGRKTSSQYLAGNKSTLCTQRDALISFPFKLECTD